MNKNKLWKALSALAFAASCTAVVLAQDPVKVAPTHYKLVFENASVRVLKIAYAAGSNSPMHQHPDAIVVALAPAKVRFAMADGKSQDMDMANESATYTPAGTHSPTNVGTGAVDALLVEFKATAPGTAALPTSRPGMAMKLLAEGPRAIAYRTTATTTFSEPAGTKHDFDQVVIALGAAQMSLSIDGKPAKTTWARGEAQFVGRGVAHEAKNTGSTPVDMVIVAIK
jgi:quercetin dioxygenase-like cupin family protein